MNAARLARCRATDGAACRVAIAAGPGHCSPVAFEPVREKTMRSVTLLAATIAAFLALSAPAPAGMVEDCVQALDPALGIRGCTAVTLAGRSRTTTRRCGSNRA